MTRSAFVLSVLALAACGGVQKGSVGKPAELRVVAVPALATVHVDEHFVGAARVLEKRPVPVPPGKRRVTIEAPGYFPHDLEVELKPGVTTLEIELRPVPP